MIFNMLKDYLHKKNNKMVCNDITIYTNNNNELNNIKVTAYIPESILLMESIVKTLLHENDKYNIIGVLYNNNDFQFCITGTYKKDESDYDVIEREIQEEIGLSLIKFNKNKIKKTSLVSKNKLNRDWVVYTDNISNFKVSEKKDLVCYNTKEEYKKKAGIIIYGTKDEIQNKIKSIKYLQYSKERITGYVILPIKIVYMIILYYKYIKSNPSKAKECLDVINEYIKEAKIDKINNELILYNPNNDTLHSTWYKRNHDLYFIENKIYNKIIDAIFNL
jgi:hypothetical protein